MSDYVEITLTEDNAILYKGRPEVGIGVYASVFSQNKAYDGLVSFNRKVFRACEKNEAMKLFVKLAKEYNLTYDKDLVRRKKVWALQ